MHASEYVGVDGHFQLNSSWSLPSRFFPCSGAPSIYLLVPIVKTSFTRTQQQHEPTPESLRPPQALALTMALMVCWPSPSSLIYTPPSISSLDQTTPSLPVRHQSPFISDFQLLLRPFLLPRLPSPSHTN